MTVGPGGAAAVVGGGLRSASDGAQKARDAAPLIPAPAPVALPPGSADEAEYYSDEEGYSYSASEAATGSRQPSAGVPAASIPSQQPSASSQSALELSQSEYYTDEEPALSQQQPPKPPPVFTGSSAEPSPPIQREYSAGSGDGEYDAEIVQATAAPDVAAYLASRPDEAAFREKLREEGQQRLAAMEAGSILIKFNEGKGMFGRKSDASRMVERWVVLNTKVDFGGPQLAWGDPKTKKISSQVRLGECKCVRYGQQSETLQSFTFNPHSAWLCFSVETAAGRTFDFAATNEADAHTWVCGLSALIGAEIDHGWLMWKALEMKMKEEVTTAGLPGMVKKVAQRLELKGEEASLTQQREVLRNSPMPPDQSAPATAPPSPPPLMAGGSLAQLPGVEAARVAKPPPKPLLSDRPSDMGSPLVEDEYTDRSLGYSGEASWSPSN